MIKQLLHDTNLAEIAFGNGQELTLTFLSMRDGHKEAILDCRGPLIIKYHSTRSSLPLYVGEVIHEEISGNDAILRLAHFGYDFTTQDDKPFGVSSECLHFVHLEGGEIEIDIVCTEIDFNGSK